jgi:SlyX protein
MEPADRIVELERKAAEQERVIDELSAELSKQWREIERLSRTLDVLARRFLALEEQSAPEVPVTRPPHW